MECEKANGPMPLILIRHTAVAVPPGTCYGQADVPLREPTQPAFEDVSARLRQLLRAWGREPQTPSVRWISSPSSRAWRLASWLAEDLGEPPGNECTFPSAAMGRDALRRPAVVADPRWMELSFGLWEGRLWDDIPRSESDPWAEDVVHRNPPGGETVITLRQRVAAAMTELLSAATAEGPVIVVVTHAGPIRVALADDARLAAWQDPQTPPPELAFGGLNWMTAQSDGRWVVGAINV